jgi:aminocarboxymuconate-semialdehyde decarboxylase
MMDSLQISTGILSVSTRSVVGWPQQQHRAMARRINEYVAEFVTSHPERFGSFATLPLPDVDRAIAEITTRWATYELTESPSWPITKAGIWGPHV